MHFFSYFERHKYLFWAVAIVAVAFILRFYSLADVPQGMTWDEAAIAYNGHNVITTRRDQWGVKLPISFRSFGDYKAPLAVYLNGVFTVLLGTNLWVVRLPFAIAGVVSVVAMMLLTKRWFGRFLHFSNEYALFAGFLIAVSPWHVHFSRTGFESGMSLCFLLLGMYFLDRVIMDDNAQEMKKKNRSVGDQVKAWLPQLFTAGFLVASIYTYHSAKIVTPLLVAVFLGVYFSRALQKKKEVLQIGVLSFLTLLPFLYDSIYGEGSERFTQASLFGQNLPITELVPKLVTNFFSHFTLSFLSFGETTTLRHGDGRWGVLYITTFALILFGVLRLLYMMWQSREKAKFSVIWRETHNLQVVTLSVLWIVIGVLPAAIGRDVPHSNRALLALPGFLLLGTWGFSELLRLVSDSKRNAQLSGSKDETNLVVKSVIGVVMMVHIFLAVSYIHSYYTLFDRESTSDFQSGYSEMLQYVLSQEDSVEKILISNKYGQPEIYTLWERGTNVLEFGNGALIKYEFPDKIGPGDMTRKNALIVGTPNELDPQMGEKLIMGRDGSVRFVIARTKGQ